MKKDIKPGQNAQPEIYLTGYVNMTTVLTSYSLVPELQHWFNHFVINSKINKYRVPPPVNIPETYLAKNSFIEMLFNDLYIQDSYEYKYTAETNPLCVPKNTVPFFSIITQGLMS